MVASITFVLGLAYCFIGLGLTGYVGNEVPIPNDGVFSDYPWLFHLCYSIIVEVVTAIVPAMIIVRLNHKNGMALATAGAAAVIPLTIYYLYVDFAITKQLSGGDLISVLITTSVSTLIFIGVLPLVIACLKKVSALTRQVRGPNLFS
ncbi:MAG: hypothetical protein EP339_08355 [Gammaproteobacteria bacterium]|uniref:hypothetical protein n=1 Tax=Marinobacter nitratireducens TaxID=1137280 RepID=UPI00056D524C|nr:hypothetical protein [Marinobacter nitratireducens]TNE75979.1 MAG: hypothetical protein EP339_08355 [Gammaproteobacteria bacterium]